VKLINILNILIAGVTVPAANPNLFGKRRKRQLGGFPAAPTTTTASATTSAITLKLASGTLPPLLPTTQAANSIDESAYKSYFEVTDCSVNQSFICVVKSSIFLLMHSVPHNGFLAGQVNAHTNAEAAGLHGSFQYHSK
jgi:hypothetical protein